VSQVDYLTVLCVVLLLVHVFYGVLLSKLWIALKGIQEDREAARKRRQPAEPVRLGTYLNKVVDDRHIHAYTYTYYTDRAAAKRVRLAVLARHPAMVLPEDFAFWKWPGRPPRVSSHCRKLNPQDYDRLCAAGWWAGENGMMRPPDGKVLAPALHADVPVPTGVPAKAAV
jgi:hypothetical protein